MLRFLMYLFVFFIPCICFVCGCTCGVGVHVEARITCRCRLSPTIWVPQIDGKHLYLPSHLTFPCIYSSENCLLNSLANLMIELLVRGGVFGIYLFEFFIDARYQSSVRCTVGKVFSTLGCLFTFFFFLCRSFWFLWKFICHSCHFTDYGSLSESFCLCLDLFSSSITLPGLKLKSLISFELIFVEGKRVIYFHFLTCGCPLPSTKRCCLF